MPDTTPETTPPWPADLFKACAEMPRWYAFSLAVDAARRVAWEEAREIEADRLALILDMTPEGFVREWDRLGRKSHVPLASWEHAYNRAGLVQEASDKGYIRIGRDVSCTITLERKGEELLAHAE